MGGAWWGQKHPEATFLFLKTHLRISGHVRVCELANACDTTCISRPPGGWPHAFSLLSDQPEIGGADGALHALQPTQYELLQVQALHLHETGIPGLHAWGERGRACSRHAHRAGGCGLTRIKCAMGIRAFARMGAARTIPRRTCSCRRNSAHRRYRRTPRSRLCETCTCSCCTTPDSASLSRSGTSSSPGCRCLRQCSRCTLSLRTCTWRGTMQMRDQPCCRPATVDV